MCSLSFIGLSKGRFSVISYDVMRQFHLHALLLGRLSRGGVRSLQVHLVIIDKYLHYSVVQFTLRYKGVEITRPRGNKREKKKRRRRREEKEKERR